MAFNLPSAQELHRTTAATNVGLIGSNLDLGIKSGGNLPITEVGTEIQNQNPSNANGAVTGLMFGLDGQDVLGSYDVTTNTRVLIWSMQFNAPNRIQVTDIARGGVTFWLGSGTDPKNNYIEFKIGGNDTPFASSQNGPVTMCIDLADTSYNSSVGTFDPTDVSAYGFGTVHVRLAGNNFGICYFQRSFLLETNKGAANLPKFTGNSNFDNAVTTIQGSNYTNKIGNWITKAGVSFFVPCPFSFGDGTSPITFNDNGVSVVSPSSNSSKQENFRLSDNAMRVYLDTADSNSDTVTLSGNYTWGTPAEWNFDISNQSICTLSGTFSGMGKFKLGSSVVSTGVFTLASGYSVVSNGANINSSTINGDLKLEGISVTYFNNLEVTGNLEFDTAGTYELEKCNISSVTNTSGGTVTIQSVDSSISSNLSPSIVIQDLRTISITNIIGGSRIQIFNVTTGLEINNQDISGSTSYIQTYAEGTDYTEGDEIRVRLAYTYQTTSYSEFETVTIATETGWSVLAAQVIDSVYESIGINGSSVTKFSADYTNNDVELNISQNFTVAEFYAWWKYNLSLSQGISNFFGVITALDEANFRINDSILSLYLDSTANASVRQTDNRRIYREDLTYPVKQPTTSGYGLDVVWRNIVFVAPVNVSVPALSAAESSQLAEITTVGTDLNTYTTSALPKIRSILVDTNDLVQSKGDFGLTSAESTKLSNIDTVTKLIPATL